METPSGRNPERNLAQAETHIKSAHQILEALQKKIGKHPELLVDPRALNFNWIVPFRSGRTCAEVWAGKSELTSPKISINPWRS